MHTPSQWLQHFSVESVTQKCKPSTPLLSLVMWDCRKIGLLICVRTSGACWKWQRFYQHMTAAPVLAK